jgi:hypothetical protein
MIDRGIYRRVAYSGLMLQVRTRSGGGKAADVFYSLAGDAVYRLAVL